VIAIGQTSVFRVSGTLNNSGVADLNGSLIVDYTSPGSPIDTIRGYLTTGYAGGAWSGNGINSSVAAETPNRALGFAEATDLFGSFPATFAGQAIDSTAVLVRYTVNGDANLDQKVDISDLGRFATNWQQSPRRWSRGDFNFDQAVDISDLGVLATNWQAMLSAPSRTSAPRARMSLVDSTIDSTSALRDALFSSGRIAHRSDLLAALDELAEPSEPSIAIVG
jgi:hypothetical protein